MAIQAALAFVKSGVKIAQIAKPILKKAAPLLKSGLEQAKPLAKNAVAAGQKSYIKYSPAIKQGMSNGYAKASEFAKSRQAQYQANSGVSIASGRKNSLLGKVQNMAHGSMQKMSSFGAVRGGSANSPENTQQNEQNQNLPHHNNQDNLFNVLLQAQNQANALMMQTMNQLASMNPSGSENSAATSGVGSGVDVPPVAPSSAPNTSGTKTRPLKTKPGTKYSIASTSSGISGNTKSNFPQKMGSLAGAVSSKVSEMSADFKSAYKEKRQQRTQTTTFAESNANMKKTWKELKVTTRQVFQTLQTLNKPQQPIVPKPNVGKTADASQAAPAA